MNYDEYYQHVAKGLNKRSTRYKIMALRVLLDEFKIELNEDDYLDLQDIEEDEGVYYEFDDTRSAITKDYNEDGHKRAIFWSPNGA